MRHLRIPWLLPPVVLALVAPGPVSSRQPIAVDLALVLAVDVSDSMDEQEQQLQRQGYVEAFRSPLIHQAIDSGMLGRIAVTYVEWAGARHPRHQRVLIPWTVLEQPQDALALAETLARAPISRGGGTSVSEAIRFSLALLSTGRLLAMRKVIDLSGDGSNNQGWPVTAVRNEAIGRGITINALPIVLKERDGREVVAVDVYYRDCVIGGPGAFMIPVRNRQQFLSETKAKIAREVAGLPPSEALVHPTQASGQTDCEANDTPWDDLPDEHQTRGMQ